MEEQWRAVKGYEGLYVISNKGNIKRIRKKYPNGKPIKLQDSKDGYKMVCLSKNNNRKTHRIHRLVAEAFIPNSHNYPVINHKDENKQNNDVNNLEWCTVAYNTSYNNGIEKRAIKRRIPIKATKNNETLHFQSIKEAAYVLKVNHGNISECLKKAYGRKTCKGYTFEYERG